MRILLDSLSNIVKCSLPQFLVSDIFRKEYIMWQYLVLVIGSFIMCYSSSTSANDYTIADKLQIGSIIESQEKGSIEALWQEGGQAKNQRGDKVVWGYFRANPNDVVWGSKNNPDIFVKIWFDVSGRTDVNFFHVSVPDILLGAAVAEFFC